MFSRRHGKLLVYNAYMRDFFLTLTGMYLVNNKIKKSSKMRLRKVKPYNLGALTNWYSLLAPSDAFYLCCDGNGITQVPVERYTPRWCNAHGG